jgi:putative restriction endonuclease
MNSKRSDNSAVTPEELWRIVDSIRIWSKNGERAPHKPLLLLHALARFSRDEPRLADYASTFNILKKLLINFGPPRTRVSPENPLWREAHD